MARTILITGASTGFGLLSARLAHGRGWQVVATARRPSSVPSPEDPDEGRWLVLKLDVTDAASVQVGVDAALVRFGSLDAVVNNAGIGLLGAAEEVSQDDLRRQLDTNFFGAVAVTRAALPHMRARRRGQLVFVSSEWGRSGVPGFSSYCASKHALEGWAECLHHEVLPFGIGVTVIEPGAFDTGFGQRSLSLGAGVTDPRSPYAPLYQTLREGFSAEVKPTGEPVAEAIVRAAEGLEPRLRVPVGLDAEEWSGRRFRGDEEDFIRELARRHHWRAQD